MKLRPNLHIVENLFGRRSNRISLALFLSTILTACGTSTAYAPGTNLTEVPTALNDPIAEQLKAGILLKWHDTTISNKQENTLAITEYSKQYGEFSLSKAAVGFDPNDPDHKPIISEILVFEKGAFTVFYDQEKKALSFSPTSIQYGKDTKTGNLTKSFAIITQDQEGKDTETPYLSYVSGTKYDDNIRELIRKSVEGQSKEERDSARKQLDSYLFDNPTEQIGEIIYNNLATGKGVDLVKKDNPNWFQQIGDFLADVNPFKVIVAQAQGLSSAEETAQAPTPLSPEINPEYSPLQTMLDSQKVPYEIVDGQIEVGGRKIIANDLGLIIFADQTGIQTWNQETNSWRVLNFSDESTFTGILKENWNKLGADVKDGTSYSTIPEYQKKLDQEIKFIRRHFILNQTAWLANNADVVKSWGKESASELSDQQIQWLYFKYNIENKQISLLSPSELRIGLKKEDAPLAYRDASGVSHQGILGSWDVNSSNLEQFLAIINNPQNFPPVDIIMLGVKTKVERPLEGQSEGNLIGLAIIPGLSPEKGVFNILHFNPSPLNNNHHGFEVRVVNFVENESELTIKDNGLIVTSEPFTIKSAQNGFTQKFISLNELINGLGHFVGIQSLSSKMTFVSRMGFTYNEAYENFPFDLGIWGGQKIQITDSTEGSFFPWVIPQ